MTLDELNAIKKKHWTGSVHDHAIIIAAKADYAASHWFVGDREIKQAAAEQAAIDQAAAEQAANDPKMAAIAESIKELDNPAAAAAPHVDQVALIDGAGPEPTKDENA